MSHSIAAFQGTSQLNASRDFLRRLFAQRPTLTQVAESMVQDWIADGFAASRLRANITWIGVRQPAQAGADSYTQLTTLGDALIRRCMSSEVLNYVAGHHYLLVSSISHGLVPITDVVSVDDIEFMLNALAPSCSPVLTQGWWPTGTRLPPAMQGLVAGAQSARSCVSVCSAPGRLRP